jgi:hypothetical protein
MKLFLLLLLASIPMFSQNIYYPLSAGREWKYQNYGLYGEVGSITLKSVISYYKGYDANKVKITINYNTNNAWTSYDLIKENNKQIVVVARTPYEPVEEENPNGDIHIDSNLHISGSLPHPKISHEIFYPENEILLDSNMTINYKWLVKDTEIHRVTREVIDTLTVTVKAGTFNNVLKIKMIDSLKHRSEINIHYEYYAPNVGLIKEEFSSSHFGFRISLSCELLSYCNTKVEMSVIDQS